MSSRGCLVLCGFLLSIGSHPAQAAVHTWPGSAPCDGGIQACIDGASPGDVVLLAADVPAGADVAIDKSLTVKAAPGMAAPVVASDFRVTEGPAGETVDVRLLQLHFSAAGIAVDFDMGSGHAFTVADSIIEAHVPSHHGIEIDTTTASSFTIERNTISASHFWGIWYESELPADTLGRVSIRQNRITTPDPTNSYGGIYFFLKGAGSTGASVHSNLIYEVNNLAAAGGIKIDAKGTTANNIQIMNNTIDDVNAGHGIFVTAPDPGATLYVFVYNNIVSNVAQNWIQLPADQPYFDVFHDFNTYYQAGAAGYGGFQPGAQTSSANPQYADPPFRNYELGVFSPCLDAGTNSVASGIPHRDVVGRPRVLGGTADRGAYERTGSFTTSYVLWSDFFSDGVLDPSYVYEAGDWSEDGTSLLGSASKTKKASMRLSGSMQCDVCTIELDVSLTGGPRRAGGRFATTGRT